MAQNDFEYGGVTIDTFDFAPQHPKPIVEISAWNEPRAASTLRASNADLRPSASLLGQRSKSQQSFYQTAPTPSSSNTFLASNIDPNLPMSQGHSSDRRAVYGASMTRYFHDTEEPWHAIREKLPATKLTPSLLQPRPFDIPNCRSNLASDPGSAESVPQPSDSGYGTRTAATRSIRAGDIQDCGPEVPEIVHQLDALHPYRNVAKSSSPAPRSDTSDNRRLRSRASSHTRRDQRMCQHCGEVPKCPSDFKKHMRKHSKPFYCNIAGCTRSTGFTTLNDLNRHKKSVHSLHQVDNTKSFKCASRQCKYPNKIWPRLDNFKSHVKRVHCKEDEDDLIARSSMENELSSSSDVRALASDEALKGIDPATTFNDPAKRITPTVILQSEPFQQSGQWTMRTDDSMGSNDQMQAMSPSPVYLNSHQHGNVNAFGSELPSFAMASNFATHKDSTSQIGESWGASQAARLETLAVVATESSSSGRMHPMTYPMNPQSTDHGASKRLPGSDDPEDMLKSIGALVSDSGRIRSDVVEDREDVLRAIADILAQRTSSNTSSPTSSNRTPSHGSHSSAGSSRRKSTAPKPAEQSISNKTADPEDILYSIAALLKDKLEKPRRRSSEDTKQDGQVKCSLCPKLVRRSCDLRKHMKRHTRPYVCTFGNCMKRFGSKNDWKRHENSQHFQPELYRCQQPEETARYFGKCGAHFFEEDAFRRHLTNDHRIKTTISITIQECCIGRNHQTRFWCGFCGDIIQLEENGVQAWDERFNHIETHYNNGEKMEDWVDLIQNRTHGEVEDQVDADEARRRSDKDSPPSDSSPPSNLEINRQHISIRDTKRSRGEEDGDLHPRSIKRLKEGPTGVYCCKCQNGPFNIELETRCPGIDVSCDHEYCESCKINEKHCQ